MCWYKSKEQLLTKKQYRLTMEKRKAEPATVCERQSLLLCFSVTVIAEKMCVFLEGIIMELLSLPISLQGEHWTVTTVRLGAFTDQIDTPVHQDVFHYFRGMVAEAMVGDLFFLENEHDGNAYVIVAECPDYEKATLQIQDRTVSIACESPVSVLSCRKGECEATCRRFYREKMRNKSLVAMSNTWGDGNGFTRVCEEFVLREIDRAAELGLDIVQVDDGWQRGSTADPARRDARNRRVFADDFWVLNEERFPSGMKYLADYGAEKGVRLGLWFAPESRDHFVCMDRDIAILKNAYDQWGFRFFKLDMYRIECAEDRDRFLEYLKRIADFGPDVSVQLDVTRYARINYLCGRENGSVFVENRYTKSGTYFPHRTLKNLWLLSRFVPPARLQFELVNNDLNLSTYAPEDEFAPCRYGMDYLFVSVMLSNPLFWMELQYLSSENAETLKSVILLWKQYRCLFFQSDIVPIGEVPGGRSITGFYIQNDTEPMVLILRESSRENEKTILMPDIFAAAEVIATNTKVNASVLGNALKVIMEKPYSWALLRLHA